MGPAKLSATMKDHLNRFFLSNEDAEAYLNSIKEVKTGGDEEPEEMTGGYVLGGDELQSYANSMYAQKKEKLIRNIAEEVFKALKLPGAKNAQSAPIDQIVKHLAKVVGNPKKNGTFSNVFKNSSSQQKRVCDVLVHALNKHYGGTLIDINDSDSVKCQKVAETMHTLLTGLHTEFMTVAGDLLRTLQNMQLLHTTLDAAYKKQKDLVSESQDANLKMRSDQSFEVYEKLQEELNRQMSMLANMINVSIGPTGKNLIALLEENKDFQGMIRDLKGDAGSADFSKKLSYLLSGVSSVAYAADVIQKALKQLGMSVAEFKKAKNLTDLRLKIFDKIQDKNPSSQQLDKLMAAAEVIYKHDYNHSAIAAAIKGGFDVRAKLNKVADVTDSVKNLANGGTDYDNNDVTSDSGDTPNVQGGDEDDDLPAYWAKKSISKKIKKKTKFREMLLKDFKKLMSAHYAKIVSSAADIANHIGNSISVSDDLDRFITIFSGLDTLNEDTLYIALSGYPKDVNSKGKREHFLNRYRLLLTAIEPLSKGSGGSAFKGLSSAVSAMIKEMDNFSDKMVNAITEIHIDRPDEISSETRRVAKDFFGRGEYDDVLGSGSFIEFDRIKNEMVYRFNIADVKQNMQKAAGDIEFFGRDYESVLGEEAGYIINQIKKDFNTLIDQTNPEQIQPPVVPADASMYTRLATGYKAAIPAVWSTEQKKSHHKAMRKLWARQRDAKVKLVEVSQAIDLYLRSFSDAIARDPDSVKSIIKMLDQVTIVAKWFNERSGDYLTGLFESFPYGYNGVAPVYSDASQPINAEGKLTNLPDKAASGKHYYAWVEEKNHQGNPTLPGNPTLGLPVGSDENAEKFVDGLLDLTGKTLKTMRALENILSAFASIGNKFGNKSPQEGTFMNPAQIFTALCEYVTCSSLTTGFLPGHVDSKCTNITPLRSNFYVPITKAVNVRVNGNNVRHFAGYPADGKQTGFGVLSGVSNDGAANDLSKFGGSIAMSSVPYFGTRQSKWQYHNYALNRDADKLDSAGWANHFYDTDLLFEMSMKSIVCKVLTVVDAYRMFHRPTADKSLYSSLTPLRTIIGGADGGAVKSHVKILPEAVELYLRLPLLAEWYREMFGFKGRKTDFIVQNLANPLAAGVDEEWKLAIVPSVDGVWSDLIKLIFDDTSYVSEGNYTETQTQKIIECINQIYKVYKSKTKASVRSVMQSFVAEMNRVFGFLKKNEIDEYLRDRRKYLDERIYDGQDEEKNFLNYDILNSEDQGNRGAAPSDRFVNVGDDKKYKASQRKSMFLLESIERLRKKMDVSFRSSMHQGTHQETGNAKYSFKETVRNYKIEVKNAKTDKEEYDVVLRMIQGTNKMVRSSVDKHIMLHEAVAAPLTLLYKVAKVIIKFNHLLHGTSLINLAEWNRARQLVASPPAVRAQLNSALAISTAYTAFLEMKYPNARNDDRKQLVAALLGSDIAINVALPGHRGYMGIDDPGVGVPFIGDAASVAVLGNANIQDAPKYHLIVRDQICALMDLCANPNKMVTYSVGTSGVINVDFSPLKEACLEMLSQIKHNLNKLRLEFVKSNIASLLDNYNDGKKLGSIAWLEEHLVERVFNNRDETGLDVALSEHFVRGLEYAKNPDNIAGQSMLNWTNGIVFWKQLTGPGNNDVGFVSTSYTVNDLKTFPFNVAPILVDKDNRNDDQTNALKKLSSNQNLSNNERLQANNLLSIPVLGFTGNTATQDPNPAPATPLLARNHDSVNPSNMNLNKWGFNSRESSLLVRFNKLVHNYLRENMDEGTLKFYMPLVESFMTGAASQEVLQGKAFPNVFTLGGGNINDRLNSPTNGIAAGFTPGPADNAVLWQSSAIVMKAFANTMDLKLKRKRHAYESLAEVPEYMKERMRTNLPYYSKLFEEIYQRAEMLRKLISFSPLRDNLRHVSDSIHGNNGLANPYVFAYRVNGSVDLNFAPAVDSKTNVDYLNGMLGRLVELSLSIKKCADLVYKELQDTAPYFMDTHRDFINDYKQRYGVLPLMPASNVLLPIVTISGEKELWETSADAEMLLPTRVNGSHAYRFNYAARLLLARSEIEPQMEHIPGAKVIYNKYSAVCNKTSMISAVDYANTVKKLVLMARFAGDGASHSRLFNTTDSDITLLNITAAPQAIERKNLDRSFNVYRHLEIELDVYNDYQNITADAAAIQVIHTSMIEEVNKLEGKLVLTAAGAVPNDLAIADPEKKDIILNNTASKAWQFTKESGKRLTAAINLSENPNVVASYEEFSQAIGDEPIGISSLDREKLRVYNILDMNIVPINVHAFMREVPFVNLLNYSYTFDRMVHDFVMPDYIKRQLGNGLTDDNLMIDRNGDVDTTRELMVKLLVHPYAPLDDPNSGKQYFGILASLFNGNDDLKMGRPRYLSDQLWHKALLTSSTEQAYNNGSALRNLELGPPGYEVKRTTNVNNNYNIDPVASAGLKFWDVNMKKWRYADQTGVNKMNTRDIQYCAELGFVRFNTKLVRNITWFVQLQRIMRVLMTDHLNFLDTPVIRGLKITNPTVTEYESNDAYTSDDFNGKKYDLF